MSEVRMDQRFENHGTIAAKEVAQEPEQAQPEPKRKGNAEASQAATNACDNVRRLAATSKHSGLNPSPSLTA